ncbi:hypothetical protein ACLESO_07360 [Pyxidicoccus sp. 3LG]
MLGLPFAGLMVGDTSRAAQEVPPEFPRCQCFHRELGVQFDAAGLHFVPDHCLAKGGIIRFINTCSTEVLIRVEGPEVEPPLSLRPDTDGHMHLWVAGHYRVTAADGCFEMPEDSRTGTLEVGTSPGPDEEECQ